MIPCLVTIVAYSKKLMLGMMASEVNSDTIRLSNFDDHIIVGNEVLSTLE